MVESAEPAEVSKNVLVFEGSPSAGAWIIPIGIFVLGAISSANAPSVTASGGAVVGCLLVAVMFALMAARRQNAEFDISAGRLRIFRRSLSRWTRTLVDCPFDQCRQLGRIEYETEGQLSYGVYIELTDGTRHAIPLMSSTFAEAGRVASQLSDATAIPKLDIKF